VPVNTDLPAIDVIMIDVGSAQAEVSRAPLGGRRGMQAGGGFT
jgi:hypothetical protein